MGLVFREMDASEARAVQSLGTKAFIRTLEAFFIPKPKKARIALKDDEIVGGFLYAVEKCGGKTLGFVDYFFVGPKHAGQGIGSALCKDGSTNLWAEGCDYLATFVRDDNVGSWASFERAGFTRASLFKASVALGFVGFLKVYFMHLYGLCTGCDLYFAARPGSPSTSAMYAKKPGIGQMALHVLANVMLWLILTISRMGYSNAISSPTEFLSQVPAILASLLVVFGGSIFFGFIGTLLSKRKWHFRMPGGGLLVGLFASSLGACVPMAGNWFPDRYENTPRFRADMGISALLPWLYLLAISLATRVLVTDIHFFGGALNVTTIILLLFRCLPFPTVNFGAVRVFRWNKILCIALVLASIFTVFFWW